MSRLARVVGVSCAMSLVLVGVAAASGPKLTAKSAVIMDARSGEVFWSKNPDQRRAPASTTKIVTTVLALESGRLDDSFTVSSRAQKQVPSKLYLRKGQKLTLRDLTYSLMLKSANDGAVVVAEGLGGSVESFAKQMTARAKKMGATQTTFRNPSGLTHAQHLSTARDLAKIMRAALDVPGFRKVAGTKSRKISVRSSKVRKVSLSNKNRLVHGYFASAIGKTGYTRAAGKCFAGAATYEGREVIVVIMGSKDLWGDTKKMIEWAHRGDGKTEWPQVQMASAKSSSAAKPAVTEKEAPKPKVVAKPKAEPAPKPKVVAKPKVEPAPKPKVVAKPRPEPKPEPVVVAKAPATTTSAARPRSAALTPPPPPRPQSAALASASMSRARSAALTGVTPRVRSAALAPRSAPPQRVAALHRGEVPGYVRSYRPTGNVRRGCTGAGCERGVRYYPR